MFSTLFSKSAVYLLHIGKNVIDANLDECLDAFIDREKLPLSFKLHALKWFTPIINNNKLHQKNANHPVFIGVNGSQGSGKSTLSQLLTELINRMTEYKALTLSLDDFYLDKEARHKLAEQKHQLFATRGVPGTHDTQLMREVLEALKKGKSCRLPKFDKSTDNPVPSNQWLELHSGVDFVFFEGWCWGVTSAPEDSLIAPVNKMEEEQDAFLLWRQYSNKVLASEYEPLYAMFDYWIMLKAPSFDCVYKWRCEQEAKLRIKTPDAPGLMNDEKIFSFIQHYQRLTERCLQFLPEKCDLVFELDENREIKQAIYQ
ncbi:hypothetical protein KUL10_02910 [Glaciecola sp. KUL10]|nr:hypothetical protein KUL10_02910 [Glaciecola sp. KUL10]